MNSSVISSWFWGESNEEKEEDDELIKLRKQISSKERTYVDERKKYTDRIKRYEEREYELQLKRIRLLEERTKYEDEYNKQEKRALSIINQLKVKQTVKLRLLIVAEYPRTDDHLAW